MGKGRGVNTTLHQGRTDDQFQVRSAVIVHSSKTNRRPSWMNKARMELEKGLEARMKFMLREFLENVT